MLTQTGNNIAACIQPHYFTYVKSIIFAPVKSNFQIMDDSIPLETEQSMN